MITMVAAAAQRDMKSTITRAWHWLSRLAAFKAYHAFAAVLMIVLTSYSARLFGDDGDVAIAWFILSPILIWISLSIFPSCVKRLESMGEPLAWPAGAWVSISCFVSISLMTIIPMLRYRDFYLFAGLAAEIAATAGMAPTYTWCGVHVGFQGTLLSRSRWSIKLG